MNKRNKLNKNRNKKNQIIEKPIEGIGFTRNCYLEITYGDPEKPVHPITTIVMIKSDKVLNVKDYYDIFNELKR